MSNLADTNSLPHYSVPPGGLARVPLENLKADIMGQVCSWSATQDGIWGKWKPSQTFSTKKSLPKSKLLRKVPPCFLLRILNEFRTFCLKKIAFRVNICQIRHSSPFRDMWDHSPSIFWSFLSIFGLRFYRRGCRNPKPAERYNQKKIWYTLASFPEFCRPQFCSSLQESCVEWRDKACA